MENLIFITPINCNKIKNLSITNYLIIYIDKDKKLKRAIPDFNEVLISSEESLINDAINAERIGVFKILSRKELKWTKSPKLCIHVMEDGTISKCNGENIELRNLLLDNKRRKSASKILKKKR